MCFVLFLGGVGIRTQSQNPREREQDEADTESLVEHMINVEKLCRRRMPHLRSVIQAQRTHAPLGCPNENDIL